MTAAVLEALRDLEKQAPGTLAQVVDSINKICRGYL